MIVGGGQVLSYKRAQIARTEPFLSSLLICTADRELQCKANRLFDLTIQIQIGPHWSPN
jgi:hypothetical protein